jgi:hypothetical protein
MKDNMEIDGGEPDTKPIGKLLMEVTVGGHTYSMYTNGEARGFDTGAVVENYYPLLVLGHLRAANSIQRHAASPISS